VLALASKEADEHYIELEANIATGRLGE